MTRRKAVDDALVLFLLYAVGLLVLVAEVFIPSHGLLTIVGLGFLGYAVYRTFSYGTTAGVAATAGCLIVWPSLLYVAVKNFRRTPMGRLLVPDNPTLTPADQGVDVERLAPLIGARGRTISPLHPVGVCEFGGRRVACVTEMGTIDAGVVVVGKAVRTGQLVVAEVEDSGESVRAD